MAFLHTVYMDLKGREVVERKIANITLIFPFPGCLTIFDTDGLWLRVKTRLAAKKDESRSGWKSNG